MNRNQQAFLTNRSNVNCATTVVSLVMQPQTRLSRIATVVKKGHIAKICHTKSVNRAECDETGLSPNTHTEEFIFRVSNRSSDPYQVTIMINGKSIIMEIDMGAAISIMSSRSYKCLFPRTSLQKLTVKL